MVNAEGPDGQNHDYEIKWTFGIRPLQQYMVEFPDGRVQVLRVSWDMRKKKWFYVAPPDAENERIEATDPAALDRPGPELEHDVRRVPLDRLSQKLRSGDQQLPLQVFRNRRELRGLSRAGKRARGAGRAAVAVLGSQGRLRSDQRADRTPPTCGRWKRAAPCHSRRAIIHADYRAGDRLYDHYDPVLLFSGLYYADGQIRDEVYELGSFTQSKMYHKGVKCSDCHDPHSLELKYPGNRLCAQCHQPGKYDGAGHHHHPQAADGAAETQCVTCHMPTRTYMEIDERRDHSIHVPRPDYTRSIGTPNVCNRCHTKPEEDAKWAADAVVKWYGPTRPDDPPSAPAIAAANEGATEGERLHPHAAAARRRARNGAGDGDFAARRLPDGRKPADAAPGAA